MMRTTRPRVVVVGAGFGGLTAVRALAGSAVDVLLLDRNNYHLFQPLLYQVAVAALPPAEIAYPVRSILRRQRNAEFRVADVTAIDPVARTVRANGTAIPYDYLILASGAATNFFGLDGLERRAFDLKDLPGALRLRNHLIRRFEEAVGASDPVERRALLTIAVVGGGPTGVEVGGAVSELLRRVLSRDYPALPRADVRVVLVEAGTRVLAAMPASLSRRAEASLGDLGVEVRLGTPVSDYDGRTLRLADGSAIDARTVVWAAGVRASPLPVTLDVPLNRSGRIVVDESLQVPGHPGAFAVGDAAFVDGPSGPVPMMAPPAIQMGRHAARNVLRLVAGHRLEPFRYEDPGTMATIGRSAAVCVIGRIRLSGFPAWLAWLFVHLVQLVGFRNKLVVLVDWAWQYVFYRPASPLILDLPEARTENDRTLYHKVLDESRPTP